MPPVHRCFALPKTQLLALGWAENDITDSDVMIVTMQASRAFPTNKLGRSSSMLLEWRLL